MNTAYVNHISSVDVHEGTAWFLYENNLAAMHYQELPISTDPDSFAENHEGQSTLEKFIEYVDEGAVLGVRINAHPDLQGGMTVGSAGPVEDEKTPDSPMRLIVSRSADPDGWACDCEGACTAGCSVVGSIPVRPRTKEDAILEAARERAPEAYEVLQALVDLRDGHGYEATVLNDTALTLEDGETKEITLLQAIQLNSDDTRWVWYRDFPAFATLQHRGTTNGWNKGSEQLVAAYEGVKNLLNHSATTTVEVLSPGQLETLCSEYLRSEKYEEYFHEYPAGGSLTAADVIASDAETGRRVISQVTFDGANASKIRALASYVSEDEKDVDLWYFGSEVGPEDVPEDVDQEIQMKSVEDVFDEMRGSSVLDSILTVPTNPSTPSRG